MNKFILLTILWCAFFQAIGQNSKWNVGINNSTYNFVNSSGQSDEFLKPQGGIFVAFARNHVLVDTNNLISKFSKSSFFFNNHPRLAKIASQLHYEYGLDLKQLNAVGDFQNVSVSYETHFGGVFASFGPEINLTHGYYLNIYGKIAGSKMLSGYQQLNNKFLDLAQNDMFKPIQFFTGYTVELNKNVADRINFFLQFQQMSTRHKHTPGQSMLNFHLTNYSIGFRISRF